MTQDAATPDTVQSAWEAARLYGCDMDLLEESLSLTPAERLRLHDIAIERVRQLEIAIKDTASGNGSPS